MLIIGITGTLGAGKGTVVDYLAQHFGLTHFSVRAFLADDLRQRGIEVNRDTLTEWANKLRVAHSPSYIIEQLYEKAAIENRNCIIESIRTPGEIAALRKKEHFYLLAVDASPEIRYDRIRLRKSETDNVSYETFLSNEKREMHSNDPTKQNLAECIRQADYVILNNGDLDALHQATNAFLHSIGLINH
ncbi:MAG TPA: hypothetical protein DCM62_06105 [Bacteroidales bacterium]|nr:hypothetical protein [Bacteroidales bacterium]